MPNSIKLELNPNEAQALADVLDIATKAGGIQIARATVALTDKLMQAVEASRDQPGDDAE